MASQTPGVVMKMVRPQTLAENIVIVDGFSRSGKTLLAPILSSLDRGELWRLDYVFEYLCTLRAFGKMSPDACSTMIRLYADVDLYHQSIGRNTNFRKDDDSGVYKNGLLKRYRERAAGPAGNTALRVIQKEKPILFLLTHYIFGESGALFDALKKRLKLYVLMERHPLWLVENWAEGSWDRRIGKDPREFHLSCRVGRRVVPWFAAGWAAEYHSLSKWERAIRVMEYFRKSFDRRAKALTAVERKKFIRVPFESFVMNPKPFLKRIQNTLGARPTPLTRDLIRKFRLPRNFSGSEIEKQNNRIQKIFKKEKISAPYRFMLKKLCDGYRDRHQTRGTV